MSSTYIIFLTHICEVLDVEIDDLVKWHQGISRCVTHLQVNTTLFISREHIACIKYRLESTGI